MLAQKVGFIALLQEEQKFIADATLTTCNVLISYWHLLETCGALGPTLGKIQGKIH